MWGKRQHHNVVATRHRHCQDCGNASVGAPNEKEPARWGAPRGGPSARRLLASTRGRIGWIIAAVIVRRGRRGSEMKSQIASHWNETRTLHRVSLCGFVPALLGLDARSRLCSIEFARKRVLHPNFPSLHSFPFRSFASLPPPSLSFTPSAYPLPRSLSPTFSPQPSSAQGTCHAGFDRPFVRSLVAFVRVSVSSMCCDAESGLSASGDVPLSLRFASVYLF